MKKKVKKIGRLIDADALLKMRFSKGMSDDGFLYVPLREVMRNIKEAPTAYDVEKVVAELESEVERWRESGEEYNDKHDIAVSEGFKRAVPIVRKGGVE